MSCNTNFGEIDYTKVNNACVILHSVYLHRQSHTSYGISAGVKFEAE